MTIYLGLDIRGLGEQGLYAVIAFYVGELCVFLFELYLILSKRNKEKRTSQVNTGNRDALMYHIFYVAIGSCIT